MRLLRMLAIGVVMLLAVGFGLCGAIGVMTGVTNLRGGYAPDTWIFLLMGLAGLALGATFARIVWIATKPKPDADRPPEQ